MYHCDISYEGSFFFSLPCDLWHAINDNPTFSPMISFTSWVALDCDSLSIIRSVSEQRATFVTTPPHDLFDSWEWSSGRHTLEVFGKIELMLCQGGGLSLRWKGKQRVRLKSSIWWVHLFYYTLKTIFTQNNRPVTFLFDLGGQPCRLYECIRSE